MKDVTAVGGLSGFRVIIGASLLTAGALLAGCAGERPRSILDPVGPGAEQIASLWWQMLLVYGSIFAATMTLLVLALLVRRREKSPLGFRFVFTAGVVIPVLALVSMLVVALKVTGSLQGSSEALRLEVISHHWWFEVNYPDHEVTDANEIHIPAGRQVRFELTSAGVVHSFWVPRLGGKRDLLPEHYTELQLQADQPGVYHGTCTEYCAGTHALMGFRLVAHEAEEFSRWLERAARPRTAPDDPRLKQGQKVFMTSGCAGCHTIRGVARGRIGPDLTLVGARQTLGAGTLENTNGNLAGWIANSQEIKPGNRMPRSFIEPQDLHALVDYLRSLQ